LEAALQKEADERREERFCWIFVCAFFVDLATFQHLNWIGVIFVFLLEVIFLIVMARKYANEEIVMLLQRVFNAVTEKFKLPSQ
jgi:hypothetical protein